MDPVARARRFLSPELRAKFHRRTWDRERAVLQRPLDAPLATRLDRMVDRAVRRLVARPTP